MQNEPTTFQMDMQGEASCLMLGFDFCFGTRYGEMRNVDVFATRTLAVKQGREPAIQVQNPIAST